MSSTDHAHLASGGAFKNCIHTSKLNLNSQFSANESLVIGGARLGPAGTGNNGLLELDELAGWTVGLNDEQIKTLYDSYFAST